MYGEKILPNHDQREHARTWSPYPTERRESLYDEERRITLSYEEKRITFR